MQQRSKGNNAELTHLKYLLVSIVIKPLLAFPCLASVCLEMNAAFLFQDASKAGFPSRLPPQTPNQRAFPPPRLHTEVAYIDFSLIFQPFSPSAGPRLLYWAASS